MFEDRVPPHSEEAEIGVLGSIFLDATKVLDLCIEKHLSVDAFYAPANKIVFEAMGTLLSQGKPVDALSVVEKLKATKKLDCIGGSVYIDTLIDRTPTAYHAEYYIELLKKKWLARNILKASMGITDKAYGCEDAESLRSEAETEFSSMHRESKSRTVKDVFDSIEEKVASVDRGDKVKIGIPTGFKDLDKLCEGGMMDGGVYWLSGTEGTGKTSLKCNIILNQLRANVPVGDLTLEMTIDQEMEKMIGIYIDHNLNRIYRGENRGQDHQIKAARELILDKDLFQIADKSSVGSISEFKSWGSRMVSKFGCKLLCVDYFQLLNVDGEQKMQIEELTSKQSTAIVDVASSLQVPVLCVAEKNKDGKVRGSRRADFAGAGHWSLTREEDAESFAPDYWKDIELFTRKARFGVDNSKINFSFKASTGLMVEGELFNGRPRKMCDPDGEYPESEFN